MRTNPISEWMLLFMLVLSAKVSVGLYEPGLTHAYKTRESFYAKVSSLTSIGNLIARSYYSLPYCIPPWGIKTRYQNLGEDLVRDRFVNRFRRNMNESMYLCTSQPLPKHDVDLLKKMIRDGYQAKILLDQSPVARYFRRHNRSIEWNGFPVGYYSSYDENYRTMNHLKFRVLVHKNEEYAYEIVEFVGSPCSVEHDPGQIAIAHMYSTGIGPVDCPSQYQKAHVIKKGQMVSVSYEVEFVKSDTQWSSRWDSYLKTEGSQVHRYSIVTSVIIVLFLMGVIARIFIKTMRARAGSATMDLSDKDAQRTKMSDEIVPSQLDLSYAFKGPELKKLLCVMVGTGTLITGTTIITITFAASGFMSPVSRRPLPIGIISFYPLVGFLGGFVCVYLWKIMMGTSEEWMSISCYVAFGFPGIVFAVHFVLNLVLWHHSSTGAVPVFVYLEIFGLWLGYSVPPTLLGGFLGGHTKQIKCPTRVEMVSRNSGARKFVAWLLAFGAGTLPFSTIFVELYFILSSLYLGRYYDLYGSLLIVLLLLIIACVLVSMIVTYSSLRAEDSGWWWKAFWASGSTAIYIFLYCVNYLIYDLRGLGGGPSVILYIGYSIIIAISDCFAKIFNKLMPAQGE